METAAQIWNKLKDCDAQGMLEKVLELPHQIESALQLVKDYQLNNIPSDCSKVHLLGMGGSAIAGELLCDAMLNRDLITIHYGTAVPDDGCGVIISSYSGNTIEVLDQARKVAGKPRALVFICSGGKLEALGQSLGESVWLIPKGYQPRAAVGWSMTFIAVIIDKWKVRSDVAGKLKNAATALKNELTEGVLYEHRLIKEALNLAQSLYNRIAIIFHTLNNTGAAHRLAAQINENGKQVAFTLTIPEAFHNAIEGIGGRLDPEKTSLIFIYNDDYSDILQEAVNKVEKFFAGRGFCCIRLPDFGNDKYKSMLYRLFISDMVSLFLAGLRGLDPTPIPTITALKAI